MPMNKTPIIFTYAFLAVAAGLGASMIPTTESEAGQLTQSKVRIAEGQEIPSGAFGVVIIKDAREASLLQLRGIAGTGVALLRNVDGNDCLSVPLRFVAGDFGGDDIGTTQAKTIRLTIHDAEIVQGLIAGQDIVSDQYRVGTTRDYQIAIQEGLTVEHGFVLNPGKSLLADVFGADVSHVACSAF